MDVVNALRWRYACKKMSGATVPVEKIEKVLEAIRLAPTSMGFQPLTVLVITNLELRKKILPIANNQSQVVDCSHLLVFCTWNQFTTEQVASYMQLIMDTRGVTAASISGFKQALENLLANRTLEENREWAAKQAYLAFGVGITAAAMEGVDATPMEGFNPGSLDELLALEKQGLRSVLLLPLGQRDEINDWLLKLPKVRQSASHLFIHLD
ncbi:MAG: NAD(P)H-dependent oxidoreductase [Bacteroidota bacterium]